MIKSFLMVGLGGALGSMLRFICQRTMVQLIPLAFPFGTLLVNIVGCFLIGIFYSAFAPHATAHIDWRLFLITGVCGGFTTFSSFSLESVLLLRQGNYGAFVCYVGGSILLGLLATVVGIQIAGNYG